MRVSLTTAAGLQPGDLIYTGTPEGVGHDVARPQQPQHRRHPRRRVADVAHHRQAGRRARLHGPLERHAGLDRTLATAIAAPAGHGIDDDDDGHRYSSGRNTEDGSGADDASSTPAAPIAVTR